MKFKIEYTGNKQKHNEPPCEGAYRGACQIKTAVSTTQQTCWIVEIDTLDELVALSIKHAPIIVSGNTLEIYDF